jgi:hypothetical protein
LKGGHVNSGRTPDPNALRRDRPSDRADWTYLPASGRQGDAPEWPLPRPSTRELALWADEWRRPQAIIWEANGQQLEVALYVRSVRDAERANASVAARTLVRQQQEALGLSQPGLLRLRWIIAAVPERAAATGTEGASVKDRFKVVQGGR